MRPSSPDVPVPQRGFTLRDTPQVQQRLCRDLGHAVQVVRSADPALRALVLTGGFARGEGSVRDGAPQNDYDLVALRGLGRSRVPYPILAARLEKDLGLHIDLQPVWAGRLPWVQRSIFWYEMALRGHTLWGDASLLTRIPARDAARIAPAEGVRLLVNRAAGLLLYEDADAAMVRIQASKALLGAQDARLLAEGIFAPSQRERWALGGTRDPWTAWAFSFKLDPDRAEAPEPRAAWQAAAEAVLDAVPVALRHAQLPSIAAYARADGLGENLIYRLRAGNVPGARRWALHPTGRVRAATLALLAERAGRSDSHGEAAKVLAPLMGAGPSATLPLLAQLRRVTLQ